MTSKMDGDAEPDIVTRGGRRYGHRMSIDADLKALATGKNFAALTTMLPSGQPQTQIMWVDADDEHVLINTELHRAKFRAMESDPNVTVIIDRREGQGGPPGPHPADRDRRRRRVKGTFPPIGSPGD